MRAHEIASELFRPEPDDGGYSPDIFIEGLSPDELVKLFGALQDAAGPWNDRDYVWHKQLEAEVRVSTLANAAELVVSGEGEQFHVVLNDLVHAGVRLPRLGAFVLMTTGGEGELDLHYWPHDGWSDEQIDALFDLLAGIRASSRAARISFDTNFHEPAHKNFGAAVDAASEQRGGSIGII
jgi:hypothetical protein